VCLDNLLGDIKPEPGTAPGHLAFSPEKSLEEVFYCFCADTGSVVRDLEQQLAIAILYCDIDAAAGVAELYGVAEQIDDNLTHPLTVYVHFRYLRRYIFGEGDVFIAG